MSRRDKARASAAGASSQTPPAGGDLQDRILERERLAARMSRIKRKMLVLSGKGGVGKSTVAANLALALATAGKRVGLLDVDIHGPSIPALLGLEGRSPAGTGTALLPVPFDGRLQVMSIGFLLGHRDDAVIWRGPLKMKVIQQFLGDVEWGDLDYLVVDCPPGTGDEPLSVVQLIEGADGAIVVTTPQRLAISDVRKCIRFCQRLDLPVLGVIENMSGFICPHCGKRVDIFKAGGGEAMADEMDVPFLGRIPIDPRIVEASDSGTPYVKAYAESEAARAFGEILGLLSEHEAH